MRRCLCYCKWNLLRSAHTYGGGIRNFSCKNFWIKEVSAEFDFSLKARTKVVLEKGQLTHILFGWQWIWQTLSLPRPYSLGLTNSVHCSQLRVSCEHFLGRLLHMNAHWGLSARKVTSLPQWLNLSLSYCCCNKRPQTWCLKTTQIYYLTFLEVRNPKSLCKSQQSLSHMSSPWHCIFFLCLPPPITRGTPG